MNKYLSKITKTTNIYFVRHAETEYNSKHLITGNKETNLSKEGIRQAIETGNFFKDISIDIILHSYLSRTKYTGELIKQSFLNQDVEFKQYDALTEIDSGTWTHKTLADISIEDPKIFNKFKQQSWEVVPEAEKISSLVSRCKEVWSGILDLSNQGYSNILAVTHGGFLNWIFKTSLGLHGDHIKSWAPIVRTNNCGIYELNIDVHNSKSFGIWKRINYTCYN